MSCYSELDRMYSELLELAVQKLHLRREAKADRTSSEQKEYHIYAYMIWNFVETVHDRIYKYDSTKKILKTRNAPNKTSFFKSLFASRREKYISKPLNVFSGFATEMFNTNPPVDLKETWEKVIEIENNLFGAWFKINSGLFKQSFIDFIIKPCNN
jgi:hypothetical protein